MTDSNFELNEDRAMQICEILGKFAERNDTPESARDALATAALCVTTVLNTRSMLSSYKRLATAFDGEIPEDVESQLRSRGIDVDELRGD